jgi:hypothetical protein
VISWIHKKQYPADFLFDNAYLKTVHYFGKFVRGKLFKKEVEEEARLDALQGARQREPRRKDPNPKTTASS